MKIICSIVLGVLMCISLSATSRIKVDGKHFSINLKLVAGKRSGWQWTTDEISFQSGKIKSEVMSSRERFPDANCKFTTGASAESSYSFSASCTNPGGSTVQWKGRVEGDSISGTISWTNRQGVQRFTFSGIRK